MVKGPTVGNISQDAGRLLPGTIVGPKSAGIS